MEDICAVIVTYNPEIKLIYNVEALLPQVDQVIIIDNGSSIGSEVFLDVVKNKSHVTIHYFKYNKGLAAGLNYGVEIAKKNGYSWCLLLDQDSIASKNYIKNMLDTYEECIGKEKIAIIVPTYEKQKNSYLDSGTPLCQEVDAAYTSGSLVKISVFDRIGMFEESLFIDYIDFEFCLRCRHNGLRIIKATRAILIHSVGNPVKINVMGLSIFSNNHNSMRKYFNARNRIIVYRRYFNIYPFWCLKDIGRFAKDILKLALAENDKIKKIIEIMRGVYDGFAWVL